MVTLQVNGYMTVEPTEAMYRQRGLSRARELGSGSRRAGWSWINANTWSLDVPFTESCGKSIRYKYFVKPDQGHHRS